MNIFYRLRWVPLAVIGFAAMFFTYLKLLDPQLVYMHQQPLFFFTSRFLHEYVSYPGGIVEYLNAFFMQWYFSPVLGALILCSALALNVMMIRALLKVISPLRSWTGGEFLLILPLALHELRYDATLTPLLCSLMVLAGLYFAISATKPYEMLGLFVIFNAAIYYVGARYYLIYAFFFLFLMRQRSMTWRLSISLIIVAYTAAVPLLFRLFITTDSRPGYTELLPRSISLSKGDGLLLVFWLLLFIFLLLYRFIRVIRVPQHQREKRGERSLRRGYVIMVGAAAGFIVLAPMLIDSRYRSVMQVNVAAEKRDWTSILILLQRHPVNHRLSNLQLYRALYFTQQLGEQLFSYENVEQQNGLYRNDRLSYDYALEYCDLLLDLGNINGAQHRAYEAMAVEGESPRVLKRLVLIHLAKEEYRAAEKYLLRLLQSNRYREWSRKLLVGCRARNCQDEFVRSLRTHRLSEDFLMRPGFARAELADLVRVEPRNKMAVTYLLTYDLLSGNLAGFMENLPLYRTLQPILPRHFEEAVVLYTFGLGGAAETVPVRKEVIEEFNDFIAVVMRHHQDTRAALPDLQGKYSRTFWFYLLYYFKGETR